jgi:hypothetical protein
VSLLIFHIEIIRGPSTWAVTASKHIFHYL